MRDQVGKSSHCIGWPQFSGVKAFTYASGSGAYDGTMGRWRDLSFISMAVLESHRHLCPHKHGWLYLPGETGV